MAGMTSPVILQLDEIKRLIDVPRLIREIETGFVLYSEGKVVVPPVGFLHFDNPPGDVHIKYGYVIDDESYVLKIASGFYNNAALGLPTSDGLLLVFSQKTGELQHILLDKCWLTDMRTAAAGAVAAKYLAPKNVERIGIIGTGVQARMQLELLLEVVDCRSCSVWGRNPGKVEQMMKDIGELDLDIRAASDIEELTAECNLIVTTTSARQALIKAEHIRRGTHVTAMGSDDHGKQELEAALLAKADRVVADSVSQCVDHGECFHAVTDNVLAADAILELGDVIQDPDIGRTSDDQITICDLTGVAIQDIQIAKMVSQRH
jgi:ornithine cyclodeaminase